MKICTATLILILNLCTSVNAKSTQSISDSIAVICIKNNLSDTERIKCLDFKSFELSNSDPESGLELAKQALRLAVKIKWKRGIALANNEMAVNYKALSYQDSSIYFYYVALKEFKELKDLRGESGVLANLSLTYKSMGKYVKSLKLLNEALLIQEQLNDYKSKAIILENIGSLYLELKNITFAKQYYLKARSIYIKHKDSVGITRNMINLGIILDKTGDYDSAISNFNSALAINTKLNRLSSIQIIYANLGIAYLHKKEFEKAIYYQKKAIELSEKIGSEFSLAIDMGNIGETYLERFKNSGNESDLHNAIDFLRKGYELCDRIGFTPPQIEFSEKLVQALEIDGKNYLLAFKVLKKGSYLKDSMLSRDNGIKLTRLEAEKEIAIKEKELRIARIESRLSKAENLKHKNEKIILALVIVLFSLVILLLYLLYINRHKIYRRHLSNISQFQSHQLRTPVVKILSIVEELKKEDLNSQEFAKLLDMLGDSTNELDSRIHEVVEQTVKKPKK